VIRAREGERVPRRRGQPRPRGERSWWRGAAAEEQTPLPGAGAEVVDAVSARSDSRASFRWRPSARAPGGGRPEYCSTRKRGHRALRLEHAPPSKSRARPAAQREVAESVGLAQLNRLGDCPHVSASPWRTSSKRASESARTLHAASYATAECLSRSASRGAGCGPQLAEASALESARSHRGDAGATGRRVKSSP